VRGFEHGRAAVAESVIAAVLSTGLVLTSIRPAATRGIGIAVQAFALLGTMVGLFTIAIGVGPRTVPDVVYHAAVIIVLAAGLIAAARDRSALAG
jgi:hypothetical protein